MMHRLMLAQYVRILEITITHGTLVKVVIAGVHARHMRSQVFGCTKCLGTLWAA